MSILAALSRLLPTSPKDPRVEELENATRELQRQGEDLQREAERLRSCSDPFGELVDRMTRRDN
jgi:hypothetical protein